MADTIADLPRLNLMLAEAEMAMHQLMTGRKVARASYDGKSTEFTEANKADLATWIVTLKGRIAALTGAVFLRRRPIQLTF